MPALSSRVQPNTLMTELCASAALLACPHESEDHQGRQLPRGLPTWGLGTSHRGRTGRPCSQVLLSPDHQPGWASGKRSLHRAPTRGCQPAWHLGRGSWPRPRQRLRWLDGAGAMARLFLLGGV